MVTSQGSMPAAQAAAPISRSPLLPSSRMTATRTFPVACRVGGTWSLLPDVLLQCEALLAAILPNEGHAHLPRRMQGWHRGLAAGLRPCCKWNLPYVRCPFTSCLQGLGSTSAPLP